MQGLCRDLFQKMVSDKYRNSHYKDKTVMRLPYFYNRNMGQVTELWLSCYLPKFHRSKYVRLTVCLLLAKISLKFCKYVRLTVCLSV